MHRTFPPFTVLQRAIGLAILLTGVLSSQASDASGLSIRDVHPAGILDRVLISFSAPVERASAETVSNFSMGGGVTVRSAVLLPDGQTVRLTTSPQPPGVSLTLTAGGVKDAGLSGLVLADGSAFSFKTQVLTPGFANWEVFKSAPQPTTRQILDNTLQSRLHQDAFIPDQVRSVIGFEAPSNADDNFFSRLSGFFVPATSATYVFTIASQGPSALYLSQDESPAGAIQVANEPVGNPVRAFATSANRNPLAPENRSAPIPLKAGHRYYLEAIQQAGVGDDNLAVLVLSSGDSAVIRDGATPLGRTELATYADPNGVTLEITQQPASVTVTQGRSATLSVGIKSNQEVLYSWKRNGIEIPGATGPRYTTPKLDLVDSGVVYTVSVVVPGVSRESDPAVITVIPDTVPPGIASVATLQRSNGEVELSVTFDEEVDPVDAGSPVNFAIDRGTLKSVRFLPRSSTSILGVQGLGVGSVIKVTARDIQDRFTNRLTSVTQSVTVGAASWAEIGGRELGFQPAVANLGGSNLDLYSGGAQFSGTYDEASFAFEKVTGDFDKVVRVESQDASSADAHAGLMVREVLNESQSRGSSPPAFSRYFEVGVSPEFRMDGARADNGHIVALRRWPGAVATTVAPVRNTSPGYPDAWLRLRRIGQEFRAYSSRDGRTWTLIGSQKYPDDFKSSYPADHPDAALAGTPISSFGATLLVGPVFAPNNLGVPDAQRNLWMASFRDYGDYQGPSVGEASLAIAFDGTVVRISWDASAATLQRADKPGGPYTDVTGAASPFPVTPVAGSQTYYRLRQ